MIVQYNHNRNQHVHWFMGAFAVLVVGAVAMARAAEPATKPSVATTLPGQSQPDAMTVDTDARGDVALTAFISFHRLPRLRFERNSFGDVISFVRSVTGANILVDWPAMGKAGISPDTAISLNVNDITIAEALHLILEDVSLNTEVSYIVDDETIIIAPADAIDNKRVAKIYDLAYLGIRDPDAEAIKNVIQSTVQTESWKDNGGNVGSIVIYKTKLVITTTALNHQRIAAVLVSLKEPDDEGVLVDGVVVPVEMSDEVKKLWKDNYAPKIVRVNRLPTNAKEILEEFRKDVEARIKERSDSKRAPATR